MYDETLKPCTWSSAADCLASPGTPESLLTRTWIWSGETVSAGPVVVGDPVAVVLEGTLVPGSGLSVRIAFQMVSALEVHWTRFGSGAYDSVGSFTNRIWSVPI